MDSLALNKLLAYYTKKAQSWKKRSRELYFLSVNIYKAYRDSTSTLYARPCVISDNMETTNVFQKNPVIPSHCDESFFFLIFYFTVCTDTTNMVFICGLWRYLCAASLDRTGRPSWVAFRELELIKYLCYKHEMSVLVFNSWERDSQLLKRILV